VIDQLEVFYLERRQVVRAEQTFPFGLGALVALGGEGDLAAVGVVHAVALEGASYHARASARERVHRVVPHGIDAVQDAQKRRLRRLRGGLGPAGGKGEGVCMAYPPVPTCLKIVPVDVRGRDVVDIIDRVTRTISAEQAAHSGAVIVNFSIGYGLNYCGPHSNEPCAATDLDEVLAEKIKRAITWRFAFGIHWAETAMSADRIDGSLLAASAGNERDLPLAQAYGGLREAYLSSPWALATRLPSMSATLADSARWTSAGVPSVMLDEASVALLEDCLAETVTGPVSGANLTVVGATGTAPTSVVGATDTAPTIELLHSLPNSNDGADLLAVGQAVDVGLPKLLSGTSYASPQVAGLASYMWLLDDGLRHEPVANTLHLIAGAAQNTRTVSGILDAYSPVIAVDSVRGGLKIRKTLLDANGDGVFDHIDLKAFADAYGLDDPDRPSIPSARDFSRYDLNGDGTTGGIPIESFDLDGSPLDDTGRATLGDVDVRIEDYPVTMNERALSDLEILCFYAYATRDGDPSQHLLYSDSPAALEGRRTLLGAERCLRMRLSAPIPASIQGHTSLTIHAEVPHAEGSIPAQNVFVKIVPTCATLDKDRGQTDANGDLQVAVAPDSGCVQTKLDIVASAQDGSSPIAQTSVTTRVQRGPQKVTWTGTVEFAQETAVHSAIPTPEEPGLTRVDDYHAKRSVLFTLSGTGTSQVLLSGTADYEEQTIRDDHPGEYLTQYGVTQCTWIANETSTFTRTASATVSQALEIADGVICVNGQTAPANTPGLLIVGPLMQQPGAMITEGYDLEILKLAATELASEWDSAVCLPQTPAPQHTSTTRPPPDYFPDLPVYKSSDSCVYLEGSTDGVVYTGSRIRCDFSVRWNLRRDPQP